MRAGGPRRRSCRARDQGGFTIPELLVGLTLGLIVIGGAMALLQRAVAQQPVASDRAAQIQQGRTMIERLTRELRQGETISGASATGLTILTYVDLLTCGGAPASSANFCRITYACSGTTCSRTVRNPDGSGSAPATTAVSGLSSPNVFTYSPSSNDPSYVGVRLVYPAADGDDAVTLDDGVTMRNWIASQ
jgi:type II secretory pathway pseudopilin PulG